MKVYRDYDTYISQKNAYLLFASTCFAIGAVIPLMTGYYTVMGHYALGVNQCKAGVTRDRWFCT